MVQYDPLVLLWLLKHRKHVSEENESDSGEVRRGTSLIYYSRNPGAAGSNDAPQSSEQTTEPQSSEPMTEPATRPRFVMTRLYSASFCYILQALSMFG